jgi:hypothetical protein
LLRISPSRYIILFMAILGDSVHNWSNFKPESVPCDS